MTNPAPSSTSAFERPLRVALAIAALGAGLLAADRVLAIGLDALYAHSGASPVAVLNAAKPDTVVVGSSTGKSAIHPEVRPGRLVNFAEDGQTVFYSIAAARAFADVDSVKRIIVAIDPGDLLIGLENPSAKRVWKIAPLIAAIPEVAPMLKQTRSGTEAPFFLTSWRFRGEVGEVIAKLGKTKPKPYRPLPEGHVAEPKPSGAEGNAAAQVHPSLQAYVNVLASVAARKDKQVILIISPMYRATYGTRVTEPAVLADFRKRLGSAPVCDLMDVDTPALVAVRSNPTHFHDSVHLTEAGARAYTAELARLVGEKCGVGP